MFFDRFKITKVKILYSNGRTSFSIVFEFLFPLGGIDILINKTFYIGYKDLTNQSKEIGGNLSVSKPDENCLEVYFPSTTAVMFCEKKKMLLFVVALGDGYKNTTKGLLGTWNDDPDDEFTLPDGTVLPPSSSLREIHFEFGVKCEYIRRDFIAIHN